jgi:hypothetical protein
LLASCCEWAWRPAKTPVVGPALVALPPCTLHSRRLPAGIDLSGLKQQPKHVQHRNKIFWLPLDEPLPTGLVLTILYLDHLKLPAGLFDAAKEIERLAKQQGKVEKELAGLEVSPASLAPPLRQACRLAELPLKKLGRPSNAGTAMAPVWPFPIATKLSFSTACLSFHSRRRRRRRRYRCRCRYRYRCRRNNRPPAGCLQARLANRSFVDKAPAKVVEEVQAAAAQAREQLAAVQDKIAKFSQFL